MDGIFSPPIVTICFSIRQGHFLNSLRPLEIMNVVAFDQCAAQLIPLRLANPVLCRYMSFLRRQFRLLVPPFLPFITNVMAFMVAAMRENLHQASVPGPKDRPSLPHLIDFTLFSIFCRLKASPLNAFFSHCHVTPINLNRIYVQGICGEQYTFALPAYNRDSPAGSCGPVVQYQPDDKGHLVRGWQTIFPRDIHLPISGKIQSPLSDLAMIFAVYFL